MLYVLLIRPTACTNDPGHARCNAPRITPGTPQRRFARLYLRLAASYLSHLLWIKKLLRALPRSHVIALLIVLLSRGPAVFGNRWRSRAAVLLRGDGGVTKPVVRVSMKTESREVDKIIRRNRRTRVMLLCFPRSASCVLRHYYVNVLRAGQRHAYVVFYRSWKTRTGWYKI